MGRHRNRTQVITWVSPDSLYSIDLLVSQERQFRKAGVWPRDPRGWEYCRISHGLHPGKPTWGRDEFSAVIERLQR